MLITRLSAAAGVRRLPSLLRSGFRSAVRSPAPCRFMAALPQKRSMVCIGTHSGTFHCDEALGCFLLRQTPQFRDADIVRSRDPEVLKELDVVIDVGGTYEPEAKRFDHHQRGFEEVLGHGFGTKLSSAGLVYKHFGRAIVAGILGQPEDAADSETVYLAVYKNFMEAIDGIDNGISQWPTEGNEQRYQSSTSLSSRVGGLNPRWNQDSSSAAADAAFRKAVALTGSEFLEAVDYVSKAADAEELMRHGRLKIGQHPVLSGFVDSFAMSCWLPARSLVQQAIEGRSQVDSSKEIVELSRGGVPWKEHLYALEASLKLHPLIKFCVYEDDREHKWRIQAVSESAGSFVNRKSLPKAWQGLRDTALDEASGIPGCVFVHASGFIGGNATREGVLAMARRALKEN